MLIPSSFNPLPDVSGCFNGQIVMGGTVAQMAGALAQLSHCKFLGEAHYHIAYPVLSAIGGTVRFPRDKNSQTHNLLYQTTPRSEFIAMMFVYSQSNSPSNYIRAELRDTASNSYSGSILDYGFQLSGEADLEGEVYNVSTAFTGASAISAPSNTTPDPVRVLYVPAAYRNQLLNIRVSTFLTNLSSVHIYDVYQPEVTP